MPNKHQRIDKAPVVERDPGQRQEACGAGCLGKWPFERVVVGEMQIARPPRRENDHPRQSLEPASSVVLADEVRIGDRAAHVDEIGSIDQVKPTQEVGQVTGESVQSIQQIEAGVPLNERAVGAEAAEETHASPRPGPRSSTLRSATSVPVVARSAPNPAVVSGAVRAALLHSRGVAAARRISALAVIGQRNLGALCPQGKGASVGRLPLPAAFSSRIARPLRPRAETSPIGSLT